MYVIFCFSLVAFNFSLVVFNFCLFGYCVSWCVPFGVYPAWDFLCFLDLVDYILFHVREFFRYYLFRYFLRSFLSLFSFWDPYNVNVGVFNVVSEILVCLHFIFNSFIYILFCDSDFQQFVLQVIYLFFYLSYSAIGSF